MYLISAYFDEKSSIQLQKLIDFVATETENDFMTKNHVPPHMTIAGFEAKSEEDAKAIFKEIQSALVESPYTNQNLIPSFGILLPYVVYATVVKNDYLSWLNKVVDNCLNRYEDIIKSKYYLPDVWLPHITIGKTLDKKQLDIAVEVLIKRFQPLYAQIVKIGLAKTNPHEDL